MDGKLKEEITKTKRIRKRNKSTYSKLFKYAHEIETLWLAGFSWQLISDWLRANKRVLITRGGVQQYMYRVWEKEGRKECVLEQRKGITDENKKSVEANKAEKHILG